MPSPADYFAAARKRARRRSSPWNLLLIPAVVLPWLLLWWAAVAGLGVVHRAVYPGESMSVGSGIGIIVMAVAPGLAALVVTLLVANFVLRCMGPARRALDLEAEGCPGVGFEAVQRRLLRVATVVVPLALGLALVGALLPWRG